MRISALIEIGVGLAALIGILAFLATHAPGRRVAALRRAVRHLAAATLPSWRWTEPDNLAGLANEVNAMTTRLRDRLDELTEERDRAGQIVDALDDGVLLLDGACRGSAPWPSRRRRPTRPCSGPARSCSPNPGPWPCGPSR